MLDDLRIKGSFREALGRIKTKFGFLTDNDVAYEEGREDEVIGRLQQKLGKSREEVRRLFNADDDVD